MAKPEYGEIWPYTITQTGNYLELRIENRVVATRRVDMLHAEFRLKMVAKRLKREEKEMEN